MCARLEAALRESPTIHWFRRDLRLADHPSLLAAAAEGGPVATAFVLDDELLAPAGPARAAFLAASLGELDRSLGGRLIVRDGDPADALATLARELGARRVVATADYGPAGRARDERAGARLARDGVALTLMDSPYVVAPGTVLTKSGTPCRVFGAYRRAWAEQPRPAPRPAPGAARYARAPSLALEEVTRRAGVRRPSLFAGLPEAVPTLAPAGEAAARRRLDRFAERVARYHEWRDLPALDATSRLSADLRFGALHPRQVLAATEGFGSGPSTFESEIAWREFYADVLFHRPDSAREDFQGALARLRVDRDQRALERFGAWARGETGYPLVDAGMRQLLAEGWMHNRVRMVCASFLVKHLHLDWRWGARWFMWRLVDADLASNQHGWQWSAGTGTDAAPFHRVFNPTRQAERFDPEGTYVRRYVSELAELAAPQCLQPGGGSGLLAPARYARPIVDVDAERREALARFAEARALSGVAR